MLSKHIFEDMADAIRGQDGLTARYQPGDMTQAILDLTWDAGLKPRTLLLAGGTLELNCLDRRRSTPGGTILQGFEAYGGYPSVSARPRKSVKPQRKRMVMLVMKCLEMQ